jgi:hypothetical protein
MKEKKIPNHSNKNKTRRKLESYNWHENILTLREKPLSIGTIEVLAEQLVEWALNDDNATKMRPFFNARGITTNDVKRWSKRSKKFELAFKIAKAAVGDRREHGALVKRYAEKMVMFTMHHYDDEWKNFDKYHAELRLAEEDSKPTNFTINIPSFTQKKEKVNAKGGKAVQST